MNDLLDLERYPIGSSDSPQAAALADRCRAELSAQGMFNLDEIVKPAALVRAVSELEPLIERVGYRHARRHNIYFDNHIPGLAADHPGLKQVETVNYTLCGDQLLGTVVDHIYQWAPLAAFLARVMDKPALYPMADPLARVNVMAYGPGEALNWHFDRAQFTTTLLIQPAAAGGEFEYRSRLRSETEPNYAGVARLLRGEDPEVRVQPLAAGSLNVFAGKNTAHRVTPVQGDRRRIIAVFSYFDRPGVTFTDAERIGFYGRAA
jgi:hypothetical protein